MKIGIISDTHKKVDFAKEVIDILIDKKVDYILHAGDIVKEEVLKYLQKSKIPYLAVFGNNDYHLLEVQHKYNLVKQPHKFKLDNLIFKITHYPTFIFPLDADVIVYGHTHTKDITYNGKNLILNPGEVCARDTGEIQFMILNIKKETYNVSFYYREIKDKKFKKQKEVFKR